MKTLSEKILATEELEDFSIMTVNSYGDKVWKDKDGRFHREDGPAAEYANGDKTWHQHGKYHREDGPAIERADGNKYWYINDQLVSEAEVKALGKMK